MRKEDKNLELEYTDIKIPTNTIWDQKTVENRVQELAEQINEDYQKQEIIIISILKGAFIFTADLVRHINHRNRLDFLQASSYQGLRSTGTVKLSKELTYDIENKNILIVEDIIETGNTMNYLLKHLKEKNLKA